MAYQILLTNLMLLLSAGLFHRGEWLPALTVLAAYVATLMMVVSSNRVVCQQSDDAPTRR